MADNSDGSVVIVVHLSTDDVEKEAGRLKRKILRLEENLTADKYKKNVFVKNLEAAKKELEDLQSKTEIKGGKFIISQEDSARIIELQEDISRTETAIQKQNESLQDTQIALDGVKIRYQEIAQEAEQVKSEPKTDSAQAAQQAAAKVTSIFAQLKAYLSQECSFSNALENLRDGMNWLSSSFKSLPQTVAKATGSVLKSIGSLAKNGAKGLASLAGKASNAFLSLFKSSNRANQSFGSGIMTMLKYSLGIRSLYALFNKLRSALTEGFKNLAQYSAPVNAGISSIMSSLTQLKNSLATAFAPILTAVSPILTRFIDMLSSAADAVARLTGQKSYVKATKVQENYAGSLENTAGAAEDAAKSLMGFDEINKLSDSSSGSGGCGGTSPAFETVAIEPFQFESWGQAFSAALDSILNDGIPRLKNGLAAFSNWLNTFSANLYEMFTFPGVYEKVALIGAELANALTDFVNQIDWETLGGALGAGLNTALGFLVSLVYNFDWVNFGASLADAVNSAIAEIDWANVGAWLWAKFKIAIETLAGFLLNLDIGELYQAASRIVTGFFDGVSETIQNIDWAALADQFLALVTGFFVSADWAGMAESVFTAIGSAFGAAASFLWELIQKAWDDVVTWWHDTAYEDGEFTMEGLLNGIAEKLKDIGAWIKEHIFQPFIDGFKTAFGIHSPSTVMAEQGGYIIEGLLNGIKTSWQNVKTWISTALSDIKNAFSDAWGAVRDATADIWNGIVSSIKGSVNGVIDVINRMISAVVNGINSLFSSLSFNINLPGGNSIGLSLPQFTAPQIPYLAQGAVIPPNREFMAVLGDQTSGNNIEAPEDLIRKIVREETAGMGGEEITIKFTGDLAQLAKILTPEITRQTRNRQRALGV